MTTDIKQPSYRIGQKRRRSRSQPQLEETPHITVESEEAAPATNAGGG